MWILSSRERQQRGSMQAGSHNSVSSNNNTSLGVPSYYRDDASSIYSGVPSMPPSLHPSTTSPIEPPRPVSTINGLNALVRNASIGLKTTPKVTTVRSPDKGSRSADTLKQDFPTASPVKSPAVQSPDNREALPKLYPQSNGGSSDALGAASLDVSASESDEPDTLRPLAPVRTKSSSPLVPAELRKEGVEPTPSAFRSGKKRPPRLDMSAVAEAEQRGSLTSLPDLIKRATRLASNLDRGKTASRLGMGAWLNDSANQSEKGKSGPSTARRSANSLTDMLASFPPPAIGTPTDSPRGTDRKRALSTWSSNLKFSPQLQSNHDFSKEKAQPRSERSQDKRRCCGLPLWLLILLIVIGICLVAVAIVIPVVFVVNPQQRNVQTSANTTTICQQRYSCQNGGASIVALDGSCQCVCINGYTGATCTEQDRTGCNTVSIGSTGNVTLGSALPRIIDSAYSNFSIPLDSSTLLGLFSSSGLSCTVENALITFNGLAQRDVNERRQAAATSEGIIYQNGGPTSSSTTLATATTTSTTAAASSTASFTASATVLDFARTAVLFVFQQTQSFNSSYAAQQNLQRFFSSPSGSLASANSLGLGSGYSADLTSYHVILPNGTMVGGGSGHA
ncbi:hypothetical protein AMS68_004822 [Peltaster fructicola]|uniref:EGF-like domain-containing protein n=1 Tax=Peltaster fructicola TaxID=286661 RepID=A0A6H0XXB6_9PEZI|nr:hypothetical protein AMS68_004822 [Peltaster fructicola]